MKRSIVWSKTANFRQVAWTGAETGLIVHHYPTPLFKATAELAEDLLAGGNRILQRQAMKLEEFQQRELLKVLYSVERLAHLSQRTSLYSEEPARRFLDALWMTVETGSPPTYAMKKAIRKYLNSGSVPREDDCVATALSGYDFIRALRMTLSFFRERDVAHLEYVHDEIEGGYIFDIAIEELAKDSGKSIVLITEELREEANRLPISVNFRAQLELDRRKAQCIPPQRATINASKAGSVNEISQVNTGR